jgi:transposase-like protein
MQKDLSAAAEFAKRFATEAACRDYLIQLRWPEGFRCPHCGGRENWRLKNARFECRVCGRQTSATAGTIFEGTRKPLRLWFRAMECVTSRRQGASARALQGLLRLPSYQTAWVWLHKLRHAMAREDPLCGTIEVGTAELLGTGEFLDFEWHGLIIIGAEVDGTRIGRVRMRPVRKAAWPNTSSSHDSLTVRLNSSRQERPPRVQRSIMISVSPNDSRIAKPCLSRART